MSSEAISITDDQLDEIVRRALELNGFDAPVSDLGNLRNQLKTSLQKLQLSVAHLGCNDSKKLNSQDAAEFYSSLIGVFTSANKINTGLLEKKLGEYKEFVDTLDSREVHASEANLDYIGHTKAKRNLGINYWLKDTDINYALKGIVRNGFHIVSAMPFDDSVGGSLMINRGVPCSIFFPLNIGNNHWVYLKVDVTEKEVGATYVDSLPGNDASDAIKKKITEMLKKVYTGKQIGTVNVKFTAEQNDGWTCGYRTVQGIMNAMGVSNSITQAKSPDDLKAAVFASIEKNAPSGVTFPKASHNDKAFFDSPPSPNIEKVISDAFPGKKIEFDGGNAVIENNGDKINFKQENKSYELNTLSHDKETLYLMVRGTAAIMDKLKLPKPHEIEIQTSDEKTREVLLYACRILNLTVKGSTSVTPTNSASAA